MKHLQILSLIALINFSCSKSKCGPESRGLNHKVDLYAATFFGISAQYNVRSILSKMEWNKIDDVDIISLTQFNNYMFDKFNKYQGIGHNTPYGKEIVDPFGSPVFIVRKNSTYYLYSFACNKKWDNFSYDDYYVKLLFWEIEWGETLSIE